MSSAKTRILLMGTSSFAVPSFDALLDEEWCEIIGLVTQPDKVAGRKKELTPPPIAFWARANTIPLMQPPTLKDPSVVSTIAELKPDLILVASYGKLLPESVLSIPPLGVINIHPSLLPLYRGPSPIQTTILNGDTKTGVSIMVLDKEMDHGPLLYQDEYPLSGFETFEELTGHLAQFTAGFISKILREYTEGRRVPVAQNHTAATITKLIETSDGELQVTKETATVCERKIRALNPEPGTFLVTSVGRLKVRGSELLDDNGAAGTFFDLDGSFGVFCLEGALAFDEVQPEGKQWMTSTAFLQGTGKKLLTMQAPQ